MAKSRKFVGAGLSREEDTECETVGATGIGLDGLPS